MHNIVWIFSASGSSLRTLVHPSCSDFIVYVTAKIIKFLELTETGHKVLVFTII